MTRPLQATNLNMQAFAEAGVPLNAATPLHNLGRLAQEIAGQQGPCAVRGVAPLPLRRLPENLPGFRNFSGPGHV